MSEVSLQGISKTFGGALAIDALDLHINDGEFFVLLGPSGCGKTTTLRCIAGLEEPDAGRITIGNDIVVHPEQRVFVPPNKRDIGMVFQSYALWPHMSVYGNVGYPLKMRGRKQRPQEVEEALALVGLTGYGDRYASALSGGQQQRVALARAIVAQPQLLLFDEPLSNLDAQLRHRLRYDLRRIHLEKGHTAVYVTHDQSEALALADRVAVMQHGKVEQIGSPDNIFLSPATRFVAEFVGFDNILPARVLATDGNTLSVLPDGWRQRLQAGAELHIEAGQRAEVAIRSSSIRVQPAPQAAPQVTVVEARLQQVTYLGDRYQCSIAIDNTLVNAIMTLEDWGRGTDHDRSLIGSTVYAAIPARDIVLLPEKE
ncbi:ABC transporter ATP-binding protein [Herbaspirillum autotrophicum]|uniref:ABC transporter ATP-binding protein n=1 Tax=Herbaspirillum autotrophicum TaxID=180195 RepID=UPI000A80A575|nr:ABC transporter ATP-binding protein [Herbaspirillum autotrophicum]